MNGLRRQTDMLLGKKIFMVSSFSELIFYHSRTLG